MMAFLTAKAIYMNTRAIMKDVCTQKDVEDINVTTFGRTLLFCTCMNCAGDGQSTENYPGEADTVPEERVHSPNPSNNLGTEDSIFMEN